MKLHVFTKQKGQPTRFDMIQEHYVELVFIKDKKIPSISKRLMEEYPSIFANLEILNVKVLKPDGKVKFK